jgi:hypothetical protein
MINRELAKVRNLIWLPTWVGPTAEGSNFHTISKTVWEIETAQTEP